MQVDNTIVLAKVDDTAGEAVVETRYLLKTIDGIIFFDITDSATSSDILPVLNFKYTNDMNGADKRIYVGHKVCINGTLERTAEDKLQITSVLSMIDWPEDTSTYTTVAEAIEDAESLEKGASKAISVKCEIKSIKLPLYMQSTPVAITEGTTTIKYIIMEDAFEDLEPHLWGDIQPDPDLFQPMGIKNPDIMQSTAYQESVYNTFSEEKKIDGYRTLYGNVTGLKAGTAPKAGENGTTKGGFIDQCNGDPKNISNKTYYVYKKSDGIYISNSITSTSGKHPLNEFVNEQHNCKKLPSKLGLVLVGGGGGSGGASYHWVKKEKDKIFRRMPGTGGGGGGIAFVIINLDMTNGVDKYFKIEVGHGGGQGSNKDTSSNSSSNAENTTYKGGAGKTGYDTVLSYYDNGKSYALVKAKGGEGGSEGLWADIYAGGEGGKTWREDFSGQTWKDNPTLKDQISSTFVFLQGIQGNSGCKADRNDPESNATQGIKFTYNFLDDDSSDGRYTTTVDNPGCSGTGWITKDDGDLDFEITDWKIKSVFVPGGNSYGRGAYWEKNSSGNKVWHVAEAYGGGGGGWAETLTSRKGAAGRAMLYY